MRTKLATKTEIMEKCITKLLHLGLKIEALITEFGITSENLIFTIANKDIVYLFDTPYVLKAARNDLLKNIYRFDGKKLHVSKIFMVMIIILKK